MEGISIGIGTVALAVITYLFGEPVCNVVKGWWVGFWKERMFHICFVNHLPPGEVQISTLGPHQIPYGHSEHYVQVRCDESINLSKFNMRFIDIAEITKAPYDPLIDIQHIVSIKEILLPPKVKLHGCDWRMIADQKGGIDIVIAPPFALAVREPFVLKVDVVANNAEWFGKISFRCADNDGHRRFAREDVHISELALMPNVYKSSVPSATSSVGMRLDI